MKHHVCNANLMRNGADFSVFINTGQEFDGSDSGARPDEAISWGKIRIDAKPVKVYADASLVFPLLVAQTFAKIVWGETKKSVVSMMSPKTFESSSSAQDQKTSSTNSSETKRNEKAAKKTNGQFEIEVLAQKGTSELKTKNKNVKKMSETEKKMMSFAARKHRRKISTHAMLSLFIGALLLVLGIVGIVLGATLDDDTSRAVLLSLGIVALTTSVILLGCNAPVVYGRSLWDRVSLFIMEESQRQDELVASIVKDSQTPTGHHLVYGNL